MIDVDDFRDHATRSCFRDDDESINSFIDFYSKHYETILIHRVGDFEPDMVCLHACGVKKDE
jgi:hypothetical protein